MGAKSEFSVGELGEATGTQPETIRWYEKIGLLPKPPRTPGNYRVYGPAHLDRLSFIRRSRALGFSIDEIRALLGLADQQDQDCGEVDAIARRHLAEVERKITDLMSLASELRSVIGQCRGGKISRCRIIEALEPSS